MIHLDFLTQRLTHLLIQPDKEFSVHGLMDENMRALEKIRGILADGALDDFECVERIVQVMEGLGADCGDRHDFG